MTTLSSIIPGAVFDVLNDTTPQLGGDLDLNSYSLTVSGTDISPTEVSYLNGVTSNIQTQIDTPNIVNDTTPKLGGMLDVNGQSIGDGTLELLKFSETGSAVNEITIKNVATGNGPEIQATGTDTNIDLELIPKGTGTVNLLDAVLQRPVIKDYSETPQSPSSTSTTVLDVEDGNVISFTLTEATSASTSNILADKAGSLTMVITAAAGSEYGITWPATWKWAGGAAPATFAVSTEHIINLMWTDGDDTAKFYATYINSYSTV